MADEEKIVMTPTKKGKVTCIKIEKVRKVQLDEAAMEHEAGGQHKGLVINKKQEDETVVQPPPGLQLEFKCFLVNEKTGGHVPESRVLKFWFAEGVDYLDKVTGAYEFFKELVKPDQFPRDYVGFIKKVMKQLQLEKYVSIKKVDVEMQQLDEIEAPLPTAVVGDAEGRARVDDRPKDVQVQEQVLLTLESAYPNILPVEDLTRLTNSDEQMVVEQLRMLNGKNLVKEMEPGKWVRKVLDNRSEVKIVKQMPMQTGSNKPTVAIITSKYYEKLAVDAMMDNKTTFVRYKTEGESNVYTLGTIGQHRVVSTKLPAIGRQRAAQISSGNTTTRLLGTFGDIEHVLLVGVGGGVPHYTDFYKHTRLGDVVVGTPNKRGFMYVFCDNINRDSEKSQLQYSLKSWSPHDLIIQEIVEKLRDNFRVCAINAPWEKYITSGQDQLRDQEVNFARPPPDSDRLYMSLGGGNIIEVGHPPIPEEARNIYRPAWPVVRYGAIGAGNAVINEDSLRMDFSHRHECACFDSEFDQCLESIVGNRQDSFIFIRGIADYNDGTKNVEWQPYASLAAAAYMRTVIEQLPPPRV